jgi:DNA-directed RNA polymerase specialized sigma24 family protein
MISKPGASAGLASSTGGEPVSDRSGDLVNLETDAGLRDLYRLYSRWLTSRLRRRFGDEADDIVQDVYIRITPYSRRGVILRPKALLVRIANNLAADRQRSVHRRDRHAGHLSQTDGWGVEPASQTDEVMARQLILGLPPPLRDVFVLSRFGGLTNSSARPGISYRF